MAMRQSSEAMNCPIRSMLALVSRYVVNNDPRSEASTGAKKPDVSLRKTRLFILFRLVVVFMCIYGMA